MLTRFAALTLVVLLGPTIAVRVPLAAPRPVPAIDRVLLVSIDGLRPDLLLRADAPTLKGLLREGSFTLWAQTTALSNTLPSHTSMLTGVIPSRHGIEWNSDLPLATPVYPSRPTLFELARSAGYTTAMVAGKSKFGALARPGTLDWWYVPAQPRVGDAAVVDTALRLIERHRPQVLFVHLPEVDSVGHDSAWASPAQLAAIARADRGVGRLLALLRRLGLRESTLVLVTADHGGAGRSHLPDDPRSRHIPWIAAGPGVRRGWRVSPAFAPRPGSRPVPPRRGPPAGRRESRGRRARSRGPRRRHGRA